MRREIVMGMLAAFVVGVIVASVATAATSSGLITIKADPSGNLVYSTGISVKGLEVNGDARLGSTAPSTIYVGKSTRVLAEPRNAAGDRDIWFQSTIWLANWSSSGWRGGTLVLSAQPPYDFDISGSTDNYHTKRWVIAYDQETNQLRVTASKGTGDSTTNWYNALQWDMNGNMRVDANVHINGALCLNENCINDWSDLGGSGGSGYWKRYTEGVTGIYYDGGIVELNASSLNDDIALHTTHKIVAGDFCTTGGKCLSTLSSSGGSSGGSTSGTSSSPWKEFSEEDPITGEISHGIYYDKGEVDINSGKVVRISGDGGLYVEGDLVAGKIYSNGDLRVNNNADITGSLTVGGTTTSDDVKVNGDANVAKNLKVDGNLIVSKGIYSNGDLRVNNNADITGSLTVNETTKVDGNLIVSTRLYNIGAPSYKCSGDTCIIGKVLSFEGLLAATPFPKTDFYTAMYKCDQMHAHLCTLGELSQWISALAHSESSDHYVWVADIPHNANWNKHRLVVGIGKSNEDWRVYEDTMDHQHEYFCCKYIGAIYGS